MNIQTILILISLAIFTWSAAGYFSFMKAVKRKRVSTKPANYPSVSIIRPVKGLDFGIRENIRAAFANDYPGSVENIFVFDNEDEPAIPVLKEEIESLKNSELKAKTYIVFSGEPPKGRTGKLNAMIAGMAWAKGELISFADSDIRPDKDALRILVETILSDPKAGSSFAPVYAASDVKTFGDAGYVLMLNGLYGSAVEKTAQKNSNKFDFIMGQFMLFKREAIETIGGLESIQGQLVDDMYIGKRVYDAGYKNIMSSKSVPIYEGGLDAKEFWNLYVKWMTFSRTGLDWSFKMSNAYRGIQFFVGLILGIGSLSNGFYIASIFAFLSPIVVSYSMAKLHTALGGKKLPKHLFWTSFMLMLTVPFVLLTVFFRKTVNWRGRTYELGSDSRLVVDAELAKEASSNNLIKDASFVFESDSSRKKEKKIQGHS